MCACVCEKRIWFDHQPGKEPAYLALNEFGLFRDLIWVIVVWANSFSAQSVGFVGDRCCGVALLFALCVLPNVGFMVFLSVLWQ